MRQTKGSHSWFNRQMSRKITNVNRRVFVHVVNWHCLRREAKLQMLYKPPVQPRDFYSSASISFQPNYFLKKFLMHTCPFYGATDTTVLDIWWCPFFTFQRQGLLKHVFIWPLRQCNLQTGDAGFKATWKWCILCTFSKIHFWCNNCWPLDGQYGGQFCFLHACFGRGRMPDSNMKQIRQFLKWFEGTFVLSFLCQFLLCLNSKKINLKVSQGGSWDARKYEGQKWTWGRCFSITNTSECKLFKWIQLQQVGFECPHHLWVPYH